MDIGACLAGSASIAFLVGFSELGSLARAFRRWTGQRLGEYRRPSHPMP